MSNLLRKVEDIKVDGKDYIMAFDMKSVEFFKELTGKGVVASLDKLATLDDETILYFIASTLRKKENEEILGKELFNGKYDLFSLVITLFPVVLSIVNNGFPQPKDDKKQKKSKAVVKKKQK